MDKNEFFRQATLRICGNLEIEKALQSCLNFMKDVLPLDTIYLEYYDHSYGAMVTIAKATESKCEKLDLLTPLSKEARFAAGMTDLPKDKDVFMSEDPRIIAINREMLQFHNAPFTSLMALVLRPNDQLVGAIVFITETEKYTENDAEMVALLKEPLTVAMANALKHRELQKLKDLLADDNRYLHRELRRMSGDEIVGAQFGLRDVMHKVQQVAALDSPVLLLGETGAGKDVIANTIHYSSSRSSGPFVSVNCGAIPDTLIDSELFGHEKGAFTGALSQKRGRFERADKGTIFLDEIGELPLQAQVRLLKVLQSKEIERVGGVRTISLDIRIIAATNRNLEEMVRLHQFREDLWFRLNVFPIWIPPLRERKADIPALVQHFISLKARELKLPAVPTLSPAAIDPLLEYHWQGNVRELENVIERALILNPSGPLNFEHLNLGKPKNTGALHGQVENPDNLDEVMSRHIREVLSRTNGKVSGPEGAAALLGVNPSTLRNRMKKMGIHYGKKSKPQKF